MYIPVNSFNLSYIIAGQEGIWYVKLLFPMFVLYCVSALAEIHRVPFDLTEGESELVSGYHVEYGGALFTLFFLAEYLHLLFMAVFISILFFGGGDYLLKRFFLYSFLFEFGEPSLGFDMIN